MVTLLTDADNTDMEIKSLSPYRYYFGQKIPAEFITKKLVTVVLADLLSAQTRSLDEKWEKKRRQEKKNTHTI